MKHGSEKATILTLNAMVLEVKRLLKARPREEHTGFNWVTLPPARTPYKADALR